MKAISLWQPWATLMAVGLKRIETRHWPISYRGELAIHAAKTREGLVNTDDILEELRDCAEVDRQDGITDIPHIPDRLEYPLGAIVGVCRVYDCKRTENLAREISCYEFALGNYLPSRFGWLTEGMRQIDPPIPCRGMQGLFNLPPEIEAAVRERMR